jgi:hypothetical protein
MRQKKSKTAETSPLSTPPPAYWLRASMILLPYSDGYDADQQNFGRGPSNCPCISFLAAYKVNYLAAAAKAASPPSSCRKVIAVSSYSGYSKVTLKYPTTTVGCIVLMVKVSAQGSGDGDRGNVWSKQKVRSPVTTSVLKTVSIRLMQWSFGSVPALHLGPARSRRNFCGREYSDHRDLPTHGSPGLMNS